MDRLTISCETCERLWTVASSFSLYKQQALESCPCPHCGAYTLACQDPLAQRDREMRIPAWQAA